MDAIKNLTAGQLRDHRRNQIVDDAGNDAAERRADHNADCHIHNVALECKLFEFLDELAHVSFSFRIQESAFIIAHSAEFFP